MPLKLDCSQVSRHASHHAIKILVSILEISSSEQFLDFAEMSFSSPEPMILLACSRNRELWEQPVQACTIDADFVKPDLQNSVIYN